MKVWLLFLLRSSKPHLERFAQARDGLYGWLDTQIFPKVIAYTTNRWHIVFMAILWMALLCGGSWTAFELVGGNYTNGLSGLMTCIIALQQLRQEQNNQQRHDQTHARLDAHEQKLTEIHQLHHQLHHQLRQRGFSPDEGQAEGQESGPISS